MKLCQLKALQQMKLIIIWLLFPSFFDFQNLDHLLFFNLNLKQRKKKHFQLQIQYFILNLAFLGLTIIKYSILISQLNIKYHFLIIIKKSVILVLIIHILLII